MTKRGAFGGLAAVLFAASSLIGGCAPRRDTLVFDRPSALITSFSDDLSKRVYFKEKNGVYSVFIEQKVEGVISEKMIYSTKQEITKTIIDREELVITYRDRRGRETEHRRKLD